MAELQATMTPFVERMPRPPMPGSNIKHVGSTPPSTHPTIDKSCLRRSGTQSPFCDMLLGRHGDGRIHPQ
jgi:hypothetical protein